MDIPAPDLADLDRLALLLVDVQRAFDDADYWGPRNNPHCEQNIASLLAEWRAHHRPVVFVRHNSTDPHSPLRPGQPGNDFKDVVNGTPDLPSPSRSTPAFTASLTLIGGCTTRN